MKKHNIVLGLIFLLLACFYSISVSAQYAVSGKVTGTDEKVMPLVNVAFFSLQDSTLAVAAVTDSIGRYSVSLDTGNYIVRFSFIGCRTICKNVNIGGDKELPTTIMESSSIMLDGVEVTANKQTFRLTGSGLIADVENDGILKRQNDVYELLGRIPGIIQSGHNVQVIGKSSLVYYINGRKVMDASEVDNLQVEQIRSVKIVTGTDVSYNAGNSAVIDILTKRPGEGLALNVTGNITQGRHLSGRTGLYSSYNTGKWDFFFSYNYGRTKSEDNLYSIVLTQASTVWNKDEHTRSLLLANIHGYKGGFVYNFSSGSSLGLQYIGSYGCTDGNSRDTISMVPDIGIPSFMNTYVTNNSSVTSNHVNLYYNVKLGDNWSLNTCADYVNRLYDGDKNLLENDYVAVEKAICYMQKSRWNIAAANIHVSYDAERFGNIAFGYDFSHSWGKDNIIYENYDYCRGTRNRETKNSLFVKYNKSMGYFNLEAGLRYEYVHSWQDKRNSEDKETHGTHDLLPSFSLSHQKGMLMQSLNAHIETQRPDFTDMNDNVAYQNRYNMSLGNPDLKSSTTYCLNYTLMYRSLYLSLGYDYMHNPIIGNFFSMSENPSVVAGRVENFSDRQALTGSIYLRHTLKWWTPMFSLVLMKSFFHYPGPEDTTLHDGRPVILGSVASDFNLPKGLLFSARLDYNLGGYLQMLKVKPYSSLNFSLKKSFLKDRLDLSVDIYDLFDKGHNKATWQLNNLNFNHKQFCETRKFGITLTWRFRKSREMNGQNAAKEEMKRLNLNEE